MATFRKRGSKWSYRIDMGVDPITGKRIQSTISRSDEFPGGFKTKKEAQTAATDHQNQLDKGTYVKEGDILFADFVDNVWIPGYSKQTLKPGTIRIRKNESGHLKKYFQNAKIKDITKMMYQDCLYFLKDHGNKGNPLSDNTMAGIFSTGKAIFSKAVELETIKNDPTTYAKLPKTMETIEQLENSEDIPNYLEKEELDLLLNTARLKGMYGDYAIFLTLAYSGLRAGELCALKWSDVDFTKHTLSVTKTYYNPTNNIKQYELVPPKTKKSKRKLEIEEIVINELKNLRAAQNELKMAHRDIYYDKSFIFVNDNEYPGYPLYIKFVENRMTRILKLAKLNVDLTPHSLRHTHTSLLAEAGVSLNEIMDRLGHKDDDITTNVYLHVTKTKKKEASQKFGELMKNL